LKPVVTIAASKRKYADHAPRELEDTASPRTANVPGPATRTCAKGHSLEISTSGLLAIIRGLRLGTRLVTDVFLAVADESLPELFHYAAVLPDPKSFDRIDRQQIASCRRNEDAAGLLQILGQERLLVHGNAGHPNLFEQQLASYAGQAPGFQRRGQDTAVLRREYIRRSALAHFAPFVEQHDLVKTALVGLLVPVQVAGPRHDLGAGKLVLRMPRIGQSPFRA
jgi:hypothetical protein